MNPRVWTTGALVTGMLLGPAPLRAQEPAPAPPQTRVTSPLLIAGAIAQLAAVGVIGSVLFTLLITFAATGIGLIPVFGIGVLVLLAVVYALFGPSWLEHARVDGLYGFGLALPTPRRSGRPGFGGFMRTIWQQTTDATMWRGVAAFGCRTVGEGKQIHNGDIFA